MHTLGTLRNLLGEGASWSISAGQDDATSLGELASTYCLGALPVPPGTPVRNMPRARPAPETPVAPAVPEVPRIKRSRFAPMPSAWDWRHVDDRNFVTPPRQQGRCGSCVAFATTAAIESHYCIETNQTDQALDLSEASLFFTANRQCGVHDPNYGWSVPIALEAMVREGICLEENYPYRPENQTAQFFDGSSRTLKLRGYDSSANIAQMKRWLVEDGPIISDFTVYEDFFAFFTRGTGVYRHVAGRAVGRHAVCVIGYDDGQHAWICKNSWGSPITHPDGCFRIGYSQCGINRRMYVPQDVYDVYTIDEIAYDPTKLAVREQASSGWVLTDDHVTLRWFNDAEDANNGIRVARRHTRHGFVGRDNPRPNAGNYVLEYWTGDSGLPWEPLSRTDAIEYEPANVVATDRNAEGWRLQEGDRWMLLAHDMNDALSMLRIVERYSRMCFIGRDNERPKREDYVMTYFE